jgi:lysophospholipase L1-like esterase
MLSAWLRSLLASSREFTLRLPVIRALAAWAFLLAATGCSTPTKPAPPVPAAPTILCPADLAADAPLNTPTVVNYVAPQATGEATPIGVACTHVSGSPFPIGTTDVICTATDALGRAAQCVFKVTVSLVVKLKGTKIVAFGDSITAGEVSLPAQSSVRYLDPQNSYPSVLNQLLTSRYRTQTITVINAGDPGERVLEKGEGRIEQLVVEHRPDVLIVLEGVNGLSDTPGAFEGIAEGLRRGVRRAVQQKVPLVLVSTILPGVPGRPKAPNPEAVIALNAEIRSWAPAEGAVLVDSFAQFNPMKELLIGQDGLHPTLDGYRKLAEIFEQAIRATFEEPVPGSPAPASVGWRSPRRAR